MRRHLLVAVALAVLVMTAGCSAILGPDDTTPEAPGNESPTTDGPGDGGELDEYPNGLAYEGVSDAEAAVSSHKSAMLSESSWTVAYDTKVATGGQSQAIEETRYVNHEDSMEFQQVTTPYGNQSTYKVADEGWQQQQAMNQTAYTYAGLGYNTTETTHAPMLTSFLQNVNYAQSAVTEQNGTTHITYSATGLPGDSDFAPTANSTSQLENISSTFTVTEQGHITAFAFEATAVAENQPSSTVSIDLQFSDFGSTSVDEPTWIDAAKNATSDDGQNAPNSTADGS